MDVFLEKFRKGGGGAFPIQKITLQILLVSKRYILVVNFGKNVQKGGRGGGHRQSKKFHCKFTHTYEFSGKKRNVISKKGLGGVKAVWKFSKKTSIFGATVVPWYNNNCGIFSSHNNTENNCKNTFVQLKG